jgi:hypothetical protein
MAMTLEGVVQPAQHTLDHAQRAQEVVALLRGLGTLPGHVATVSGSVASSGRSNRLLDASSQHRWDDAPDTPLHARRHTDQWRGREPESSRAELFYSVRDGLCRRRRQRGVVDSAESSHRLCDKVLGACRAGWRARYQAVNSAVARSSSATSPP